MTIDPVAIIVSTILAFYFGWLARSLLDRSKP
ncbi:hypothetical protein SAMN05428967_4434 [Phyllobacterium sp. YR620]|nr:hypothetical protein SAMN05428967_4434 [Phyllobacterium sp. YR620]